MKLKQGDNVTVITGKDKGVTGKIERVLPRANQVVITGVNIKKVHRRARSNKETGQILERAYPIDASNVMLKDPQTGRPTRVGSKLNDNGRKVRVAKQSKAELN